MLHEARTFPVTLESWGWSRQGDVREENQDSFLNWAERMLWVVIDGVGGSDHGGAAGRAIARALLRTPPSASLDEHVGNVTGRLRAVNGICRRLYRKNGESAAGTVVALLIHGNTAACLWAGDSRCYLFRDGVLYQCTKDHTLRQKKIDTGELTAPEAQRMVRGNVITNAVGVHDDLRLDQVRFSLRSGDRFLLCSDGLFNLISPDALAAHLTKPTLKEAVDSIVASLDDLKQPDNVTFVTVFLSKLG